MPRRTLWVLAVLAIAAAACGGDDGGDGASDTTSTTAPGASTTSTPEPETEAFAATSVEAGDQHACGLDADGAAWCWGYNFHGQLGDGTNDDRSTPTSVDTSERFTSLAAGRYFTCGLTGDGSAWCWGDNSSGQLGNGENGGGSADANRSQPSPVQTDAAFTSIVAGQLHVCGLDGGGQAWCWGAYASGQLGNDAGEAQAVPVRSAEGLTFASLANGGDVNSCGLTEDGTAWCFGNNTFGQLGRGDKTNARQPEPSEVSGDQAFVSIALGPNHACALTDDGRAWCWGANDRGQLGDGSTEERLVPAAVDTEVRFSSITADDTHTCAVDVDDRAWCWGNNGDGRLGTGGDDSPVPAAVEGDLAFEMLSAGEEFTCGVTTLGEAHCWGSNRVGWLGTGSDEASLVPIPVVAPDA